MYSCLSGSWTGVALLTFPLWASFYAAGTQQADERTIRSMVEQAIARLNRGDATAFDDFWAEDSDYVGVDGTLTKGRLQIQDRFRKMNQSGTGQQTVVVEQVRFVTPELASVDGLWTVTGAHGPEGTELPPMQGRGFELVQKRDGRWRFIVTRQMVVFQGK